MTGTLRSDRKGIPKEMKTDSDQEEKSSKWCFSEKKMLISYMDKKKAGKKNVLFLTTMFNEVRVSRDQRKKPQPIVYYDHMKGGVDVVDLVSIGASTRSKSRRWPINANAFECDTVKTNARTLYNEINGKNLSNFEFTHQLGKELVLPFIQQRYASPVGLQSQVLNRIRSVLYPNGDVPVIAAPTPAPAPTPAENQKKGRCRQCVESIAGNGYASKKSKLSNKLTNSCMTCGNIVCLAASVHVQFLCGECNKVR